MTGHDEAPIEVSGDAPEEDELRALFDATAAVPDELTLARMKKRAESIPDPERGLRELFDATATEADGPTLTRLGARAVEVPARQRSRWWKPVALFAPALAVAAGTLFVVMNGAMDETQKPQPLAAATAVSARTTQTGAASVAESAPAPERSTIEDDADVMLASFGGDADSDMSADFGYASATVATESDADAWLAATDELLEGM